MSPDADAVRAVDLHKFFGETEAVRGLNLRVPAGSFFGFLGPNGAGKTTTIGMLCTLLRPTAGTAYVAGHDVVREADEVRRRIGIVFQDTTLDGDLTADENLRFQAALFGLHRRLSGRAIDEMLELVGLSDRRDVPVRMFSGGMRRRLEIARGLLHAPSVLFLDEPTSGLDPQTRLAVWEYLRQLRSAYGITVFLTTHHLEEAENCDEIAIIDDGAVIARGTPTELKGIIGSDRVRLRTADDEVAVNLLKDRFGLLTEDPELAAGEGLEVRVADGAAFLPRLVRDLGVPVLSVTVSPPSLDDVFVHYTGRTIREGELSPMTMADLTGR